MRRPAILLLVFSGSAWAQSVAAPEQLPALQRQFEARPGVAALRCEVSALPPILNFAFRFQAGYTFRVAQSQYTVAPRGWSELTTITPDDGSRPTSLIARQRFTEVTREDLDFVMHGVYLLGEGTYSVESAIRDDSNRVCRKQWKIVVKPPRAQSEVQSALPMYAVRSYSAASSAETRHVDDAAGLRLSILVNAAAFSMRRTTMEPVDRMVLLNALTAMLEHLPAKSVRLVAFSLEQQRELFRSDDFALTAAPKLADAIAGLQTSTVDVRLLQNPLGHVDFLAGLINRELESAAPPDAVIFLGPPSRYENHVPAGALHKPAAGMPRFFYLQYQGPRRIPMPPGLVEQQQTAPLGGRGVNIGQIGGVDGANGIPDASSDAPPPIYHQPASNSGSSGSGSSSSGTTNPTAGNSNGSTSGSTGTNGSSAPGSRGSSGMGGGGGVGGGGRGGRGTLPGAVMVPEERITDVIRAAVSRLKGKTLLIHTPADLAKAIRRIEHQK